MENNNTRNIVISVIAILILIIGGTWLWGRGNDQNNDDDIVEDVDIEPRKIVANHTYSGGTHTIEGNIALPTPCHDIEVVVEGDRPEADNVMLLFTTIEPSTDEVCTQNITEKLFSVSFEAVQDARIDVRWDGQIAAFDLRTDDSGNEKL